MQDEELVAVVRPYQHKAGSWSLTLPKDIVVETGLEASFMRGAKIPVYFDKENRQVVYQLPKDRIIASLSLEE